MSELAWRQPRRGGVAHAWVDGRRYSVCAEEEMVREATWLLAATQTRVTCLLCRRLLSAGCRPHGLPVLWDGSIY